MFKHELCLETLSGLPTHSREKAYKEVAYVIRHNEADDTYLLRGGDSWHNFFSRSSAMCPTGRNAPPGVYFLDSD